jgi:glycyl-tRNA synthetase beta chain
VLVSTLQSHQRYFPIEEVSAGAETGRLLPSFVAVSNLESRDPEQVRLGNQRVIRPRLDDAAFFWDTDRKRSLASRRDDLKDVIFQKSLGSLLDKSARVDQLAQAIATAIGADVETASRAAQLGKCDLTTDMVGEFPDLQGIMGRYYALNDDESEATARAIEEQYLPRHAGDALPGSPAGQALAIAEKLDTLAGIFGIGQKPTGTRDPFGLRRGALGVLRIAIECGLDLDLRQVISEAAAAIPGADDPEALAEEVFDYIMDRLRAYYADGVGTVQAPVDVFEAVLARRPSSPLDFHRRIEAVLQFVALPAAGSLSAANKRVANILDKAEEAIDDAADPAHMIEKEEKALFEAVTSLSKEVVPLLNAKEYRAALEKLATLRKPVDDFFDAVMVMDEDAALRQNRLALLKQMRDLFLHAADLSKLTA